MCQSNFCLRLIIENCLNNHVLLVLSFTDYNQTFDLFCWLVAGDVRFGGLFVCLRRLFADWLIGSLLKISLWPPKSN